MNKTKVCVKCSVEKSVTCFHRDARRDDGRFPYCKDCRKNPNRAELEIEELALKGLKKCTLCLKVKPFNAFDQDSSKRLGVTSRCKKCHKEARVQKASEWHRNNNTRKELNSLGLNCCYKCKEVKPFEDFLIDRKKKTGYQNLCKSCNNSIRSRYRLYRKKSSRDYTRWEVFEDDNFTCYLCEDVLSPETHHQDPKFMTIDHVVPISLGGLDERDNVRTACLDCNKKKSDIPLDEFLMRLDSQMV